MLSGAKINNSAMHNIKSRSLELTLAILKPHIVKAPHALENIRDIILENGFLILKSKRLHLTMNQVENFYEEHKHKFFYNRLTTFMTSGESEVYLLAKENAIKDWRQLMGGTKVYQTVFSDPDSIRGLYGLTDTRNATHGSDSPESVLKEMSIFFPDFNANKWLEENQEALLHGSLMFDNNHFVHLLENKRPAIER